MKYVLFSGSLRTDSLNRKLIAVVQKMLGPSAETTVVDLRELALPVYDGDIEAAGIPEGVKKLGLFIQGCDALIISGPEYNGSISGSLKNTIDWVSRLRPVPLTGKPVFLLGASPGAFGAVRALAATRPPLETLGAYIFPQMFGIPKAHEVLVEGGLADTGSEKRLAEALGKFQEFAARFVR